MWYLFEEVGVISSPSTHRSARLWTSPRQHRSFYSYKRPYGGCATANLLVVLIYTQVATSAFEKEKKKVQLMRYSRYSVPSFQHECASKNLNPYFPLLLLSTMENRRTFSPCQVKTALFHNCTTGTIYGEQGTINLCLSDSETILVSPAPSPFHLCLDSSARALDLRDLGL
jgi:hypothetical protein